MISEYFPGEDVIHFDGDIVFNEDPHVIEKKMHGKTFVLQGCPALTVISNTNWYAQYKYHLDMFVSDITGYSTKAWKLRIEGEEAERNWLGLRDRKIISSDQDLLRHLIHTAAIHQDSVDSILNRLNGYIMFENPLFIEVYYPKFQPFKYKRIEGIDYLNDRKVVVWHMQSYFIYYLNSFVFRKKQLSWLPGKRLELQEIGVEYYLRKLIGKMRKVKYASRLEIYKYFFEENDFSEIFTDRVWWKTGVFN